MRNPKENKENRTPEGSKLSSPIAPTSLERLSLDKAKKKEHVSPTDSDSTIWYGAEPGMKKFDT